PARPPRGGARLRERAPLRGPHPARPRARARDGAGPRDPARRRAGPLSPPGRRDPGTAALRAAPRPAARLRRDPARPTGRPRAPRRAGVQGPPRLRRRAVRYSGPRAPDGGAPAPRHVWDRVRRTAGPQPRDVRPRAHPVARTADSSWCPAPYIW